MAVKTTTANMLQNGHRRRVSKPILVRGSQLSSRYITERRIKHERRLRKQQQKQQQQQQQSVTSSATATPEPSTPPCESTSFQGMTPEKKEALQHILGRTLDDKDRSAADILATLYVTGLLDRKTPTTAEASGATTPIPQDESDVEPSEVALPSMQQTEGMLEVWRSDRRSGVKASTTTSSASSSETVEAESTAALSSSPMTPALSSSSSSSAAASARSSFSTGSPDSQSAQRSSVSGPPPPPYDAWRKSIGTTHSEAVPTTSVSVQAPLPAPLSATSKVTQSPFSTYEQNYFCSSRRKQKTTGPNGMPSPPQSPTNAGRPREYSYKPATMPTLPSLPSFANLPTPPQSFSASMQPAPYHQPHQLAYQSQTAYQPRYNPQYELPAPMPTSTQRRSIHGGAEDITTTVLTLPPPGVGSSLEPLTPVSPLTLPSAFGRRATMPVMPSVATIINGPYHNSPRMAAKMDARRERMSSASSPSTSSASKKAMPKPHCNVKYETAELDFIMYQRTTKNRAWDDVTAAFNAALPRLRQYADMDSARLNGVGLAGATSPGGSDKMDRYRARPERTTPGLQASYYRQRLALPLLDESGQLVFDDATNKQLFTEVMVRDDKSRKKLRRMTTGPTAVAPTATPLSSKANPDDARVHLVLYFPERVTYYDYWFVSDEDKALARQRTYERNMQRHQRGLPSWQPGNDDPESGILTRKE
ncbi:hypothetical protein SPBR_00298 [Sporothrix brasiliensis 5110]|uniref:Uncharacterized protein n=1 Tax=Sporothrix brasiliensis 5110 TaxID=1398154 RepID=A0A0C2J0F8_9PEZI|nr:uncharacterized protein SPBR_00298 [Sporothrix brasiliensis 5110]KIH90622.1 hypothetical protein SPBR_00298 [Sporothrix brasiliensis 5110]